MMYSLAPMEGLTGHVFRRVHAEMFGALDRYYTPFLTPPRIGSSFGKRDAAEVDPAQNDGLDVVPQLISKHSDEFVYAAQLLAELGYREVNLNLGCPSGTVVGKGRGAGMLRDADALDFFLDDVCSQSPIPVSVKTRLGLVDDGEFPALLDVFRKHPLSELIVHPRVQRDRYQGSPRWEAYGASLANLPFPVAYNGDILSVDDARALIAAYPTTRHIMLGRGILANPALARMLRGGKALGKDELKRFHDALFEAYTAEMGGNAVFRMKEWWSYAKFAFEDPQTVARLIRKVRKANEYEMAVERAFQELPFAAVARFQP